jgi:hypothetical protein
MTEQEEVRVKCSIYDQFKLAEQCGSLVTSRRLVKILRYLQARGPLGEGKLSNLCGERTHYPDWGEMLQLLVTWKYIQLEPTGQGRAQTVSLAENGKIWIEDLLAAEKAKAEADAAVEAARI